MRFYSLPPATKLGQGYVFTGVCDSVNRGGVPHTPPGADPPEQTPREQTPPRADTPPGSRHPPPEQTPPPGADPPPPGQHAVRYGQRAGGTHPTGMQSRYLSVFVHHFHLGHDTDM